MQGAVLKFHILAIVMIVAAILGDSLNYWIGRRIGPKVFRNDVGAFLNKKHLVVAEEFYEKHGGKTVILARFLPIIRTFAPFVAGIGKMPYLRFIMFSIVGANAWILTFLFLGSYFGNIPIVKENFHFVVLVILVLSILPFLYTGDSIAVGGG
jgi:membrane-associated protein